MSLGLQVRRVPQVQGHHWFGDPVVMGGWRKSSQLLLGKKVVIATLWNIKNRRKFSNLATCEKQILQSVVHDLFQEKALKVHALSILRNLNMQKGGQDFFCILIHSWIQDTWSESCKNWIYIKVVVILSSQQETCSLHVHLLWHQRKQVPWRLQVVLLKPRSSRPLRCRSRHAMSIRTSKFLETGTW